jgi:DNA-binding CsgD family transcriptional regulator
MRNFAVPALLQLGRNDEAQALAEEELALARSWGAPGTIGGALRSVGLAAGGDEGLALLRESVRVLEPSGMRLYLTRSLLELGTALRRSGRNTEAREPLERAMGLAHEISADGLAQQARDELSAAGARPRRTALRGVDALTASERRVAQFAAQGMTNREVAQALFVTPKTVEKHLRNAYDKLGITSRPQLAAALSGG